MAGKIKELSDEDFKDFIASGKVVVDFWAPWCGPCRMMAPEFEEASEELKGKVKFAKVDVDKNPELSSEYEIRSIPTLLYFEDGELKNQTMGAMQKDDLVSSIRETFSI